MTSNAIMSETLTVEELASALETTHIYVGKENSGYGGSLHSGKATYPEALARDLFRQVEKNREPAYESGAIYRDAHGETWKYAPSFTGNKGQWFGFGISSPCGFDVPKRPLTKLAPETTKWNINWNNVNII